MGKKTVMASITGLAIVISLLTGMQAVEVAKAIPPPDLSNIQTISIVFPTNNSLYNTKEIALIFNVNIIGLPVIQPSITQISYRADWQNGTLIYENEFFPDPSYNTLLEYSGNLTFTEVPEGNRSIVVDVTYHAWYIDTDMQYIPINFWASSSSIVDFTIDITPPKISNLSLANKSYNSPTIPLNFTIDEPVSWIGYSIDGQSNITVAGNATVTGLFDGSHNLVVYANDTAGNTGKSDTVFFNVNTQPSPTPSPSIPEFPSWILLTLIFGIFVFVLVLRKRVKV